MKDELATLRALLALGLALVVGCGDNITPTPDASAIEPDAALPLCSSLGDTCQSPLTIDRVCASGGACFCDVNGQRERCVL